MLWHWLFILIIGNVDAYIADSTVTVISSLEHEVSHFSSCTARFGPEMPDRGVMGKLAYASPADGCTPIERAPQVPNNHTNWIVLIRRNGCNFVQKVYNAQVAGYVAAIIHNVNSDALVPMSGEAGMVKIPSVFVGMTSANELLKYNYSLSDNILLQLNDYNYTKFLWPLVLVLVVVMSVLILFTVLKCIVNQIRKCMSRISPSALRKLPVKKFKKGDKYEMCAICLEEYESGDRLRLLPCSHAFHKKCIDPWLTRNKKTCPLCKKKAFSRSGSRSYSDSDDSDDERVIQSTERTPLLSANTSNRTGSPNVGLTNSVAVTTYGQPRQLNTFVVDEAVSFSDHSVSSSQLMRHHQLLESSVEVHYASGQDDLGSSSEEESRSQLLTLLPSDVCATKRESSNSPAILNDGGGDEGSVSGGCVAAAHEPVNRSNDAMV